MARPRIARSQEEAEAIPIDQTIQVALSDEVHIPAEEEAQDTQPQQVEAAPEVIEDEPAGPDISALQKQIEALQKAEKAATDLADFERRRAEEAIKRSGEFEVQSSKHQEEAIQAQYDTIVNALEASKAEARAAKMAMKQAKVDGDLDAEIEANDRLSVANSNLTRLEDGKAAFESRQEALKNQPKPQPSQSNQFEAAIAVLPGPAQIWMRQHPEYITDRAKNEDIQFFHNMVLRVDKKAAFTPEYFETLETHLGLRQKPHPIVEEEEEEAPPLRQRNNVVTQAPPTREVPSAATGKPVSSKVTLSPDERAMAKSLNLSDLEYAKQKLKMAELKRNGHYNEGR